MSNLLVMPRRRKKSRGPSASASNTSNVVSISSQHGLNHPTGELETVVRWEEDPDGGNAMFSENWSVLLGPEAVEQHRLGWHRLIHPDDRFDAVAARYKGLLSGCPYEYTCRYWVLGDYRPVHFSSAPLRYEVGEVVRWGGCWRLVESLPKRGGAW